MTLGYKEIYVVGMGYEYVSNDYHVGHKKNLVNHKTVKGSWISVNSLMKKPSDSV